MNTVKNDGAIKRLCEEFTKYNVIPQELYSKYNVHRGLRNSDGTGVVAGLTNICNVHGYIVNEGEKEPMQGELIYRGYNVKDIVSNTTALGRYGFEETVYLLLFGQLPTVEQLELFKSLIAECRELPKDFAEDMIFKAPSKNIMNKLARSVLALYSYDNAPEDYALEAEIIRAVKLISRMPNIMVNAYQVKKRYYDNDSLFMHPIIPEESTAESILSALRFDRVYTREEALLLDLCLILHAEHGGGNNSTFACRTLTSSGTDAYAAYSAAIGSLKGHRHGGANIKVMQQLENIENNVADWENEDEIASYLRKIIRKEANDGTGLVYGMGHAVYTLSDPRAVILKENAFRVASGTEYEKEFNLLRAVEKLTPEIYESEKQTGKVMCANVDMYSGLVYKMLGIPFELFTPLFAISRMAGWSAHRIEEMTTGGRIIRPAYKAVAKPRKYIPIEDRS